MFLGGFAAGLAWLVAERLAIAPRPRFVLCAFFFAGTDLLWCSAIGDVLAAFFGVWLAYNRARWGHVWDSGHTVFYHEDSLGQPTGSPFSLANVPNQLSSFFLAPPVLTNRFPYVLPSLRGTGAGIVALWIAAACVAIPSFFYYVNGFSQYGMRHALDFEPFLFVLMLYASTRAFPKWVTLLSLYSVAASVYGLWFWLTFAYQHRS